jgi:Rrf2 family protein
MSLLNRDTDYAVRALCFIARHGDAIVSVSELAASLKLPRPFLRKILQKLNRKGLLSSYKGQGGGFKLAVTPQRIFVFELIKAFQGSLKLNECFLQKQLCPERRGCPLKKKIDAIERGVISELKAITIASLIDKKGG